MERCSDCKLTTTDSPCTFHDMAIRGDWFADLEARLAGVLGPDMLDDVFEILAEMEIGAPTSWMVISCHHDLPIGLCVIPTCNDLPTFGGTKWEIADRAISTGISLN